MTERAPYGIGSAGRAFAASVSRLAKAMETFPMDPIPTKGCSHGKTFDEPCTECELVLCRKGLEASERRVAQYRERIAELLGDGECMPDSPKK